MTDFRQDFLAFALARDVLRFGEFVTKAGRKSPYFFNAGLFDDGESLRRLGQYYAEALLASGLAFDQLFGPAYKGITLVAATGIALAEKGHNLPFSFNRKEAKDHGEGGVIVGAPLKGRVVIVDDVITDGGAKREAIELLRAHGANPVGILIAFDRMEKGRGERSAVAELEREFGLPVIAIATLDDLMTFIGSRPELAGRLDAVMGYRRQYGAAQVHATLVPVSENASPTNMPLPSNLDLQRERTSGTHGAGPGPVARRDAAGAFAVWTVAALALAALILSANAARAATYKWVDDQGVVHYTDKMPPEAINKGSIELNKQGVAIKKNDPALTPEQRRAREAEEERARQVAKAREEIQRKDRALLQSYTTESEIDLSKKRALGTIDAQIQSAQAYVTDAQQAQGRNPGPRRGAQRQTAAARPRARSRQRQRGTRKAGGADRHQAQGSRHRDRTLRRGQAAVARTPVDRRGRGRRRPTPRRQRGTAPPGVNPAAVPTSTRK